MTLALVTTQLPLPLPAMCECGCGAEPGLTAARPVRRKRFVHGHNRRVHWTPEIFWARVDCSSDGCWPWPNTEPDQYGQVSGQQATHRMAWEFFYGSIPPGKHVLHHCDNPPCVRPSHLFIGDQRANVADMIAKGRDNPRGLRKKAVA